ncbi:MAG TPA: cytochrome P450 [Solirubrobacteraceae bacterium]|nr:cytochrome P450 [Solirubrobacteraceae bacterium]HUA47096.1 cytochrome P450 [Solirubrobacteraceae bacterium]
MATVARQPSVAPPSPVEPRLPPGPRLPRILQTFGFMLAGPRFLEACRRRYGNVVTFSTVFDQGFVMLFDPAGVKELFQGPHEQLRAGEANAMLGPVVGERSVLLLDGTEHMRHRRLMLPPFHGRRMHAFAEAMQRSADVEIDSWPIGESFALLPSMQTLTLRVIVQAVFGYEPGAEEEELRRRLRAMVAPLARPRSMALLAALPMLLGREARMNDAFAAARRAVDEVLFPEIARRRALGDAALSESDDVFSALLLAQDEDDRRLSDAEVRDELVTLLLAGHETTATGLAWCLDLLLHAPAVLGRARERDERYLDAVVKESLRIRPVIPGVGRVVRGDPFRVGGYTIPPGVEINPSIRVIHRREDLYPQAGEFRPERFLVEDPPDTYTWIPFGGGTRRCLGASFALMEMRIVLARVLERAGTLRAADPKPAKTQFRAITLAPRDGTRVIMDQPPRAGA